MRHKNKVFLTGAGGFVGANIVRRLLEENYSIYILNHNKHIPWRLSEISNKVNFHKGDITKFKVLRKILKEVKPDYIIHLAAYGSYAYQTDSDKIISVNIQGTKNLLEASADIPYKIFINTGSSSEYGFKSKPMREKDSCNPVSYYGITKLMATHMCRLFAEANNKPIITFRLFSVYGPFEEESRFVPTIINSLIKNKSIRLTPGRQRRDFIYVDDVVHAYLLAIKSDLNLRGDVFNIGTGKEYSNDDVVKKLFLVTKNKTDVQKGTFPKRTWDTNHWKASISKAKRVLKWNPKYSLEKGLEKNYLWFRKNINLYKKIYV